MSSREIAPTALRLSLARTIRRAAGLAKDPPPRCNDPATAYGDVYGVARVVHGDLPAMLIGGVASLKLQMLHPHAMAGVAEHSRYQHDPLGRLLATANFIAATTYGSRETAAAAIARVQRVHDVVHGVADDGTPYDANDPHLLLWIHCAEIAMFLRAYQRYGATRLTAEDADEYVNEMTQVARDLGVLDPPSTVAALEQSLQAFLPELRLTPAAKAARDFIATGVVRRRSQRVANYLIVRSAWSTLPDWARNLLEVRTSPLVSRLLVRPLTPLFARVVRSALPSPRRQVASDSPPSTTTT